MTTVSVIIPTFNRARKVVRAISSVLYQTFKDYEILVVDGGSTDDTKKCLQEFGNSINSIQHSQNLGVSSARNTGIKASASPLIAFLDSDDYWLPKKLVTQMNFFQQNPEAVACQTDEIWVRKGRRVNPMKKHIKLSGDIFLPSLKQCVVSPSAVMLRQSVIEEVGLFDETMPACEDYDLWLRIGRKFPIHLIKNHLVVKEGGAAGQLSARYTGMDRFRIYSMLKLIQSGLLQHDQIEAALKELSLKCDIYGNGCLKRGKIEEGEYYLKLPENLKKDFLA